MLEPLEPDLRIRLEATDRLGHICAHVDITPDHLAQTHRVEVEIGQGDLPAVVQECTAWCKRTQFAVKATKNGAIRRRVRWTPDEVAYPRSLRRVCNRIRYDIH